MIKKIALIAIILLVLGAIVVSRLPQNETISDELSDRSKEFIQKQKISNNSQFSGVLKGEVVKGQRFAVKDCFSLIIPFGVTNERQEEGCSSYFSFERPRGSVVAFSEKSSDPNLERASGFSMRKQNPQQYEEKQFKIGERNFVGFVDKNENYAITSYIYLNGQFIVITLSLPHEDEKSLKEILSSLEV